MSRKRPGWRSAERTFRHLSHALHRKAHDSLVLQCLEAMEQARAALPDAWLAVQCNVPTEVVAKLDAAIATATKWRAHNARRT